MGRCSDVLRLLKPCRGNGQRRLVLPRHLFAARVISKELIAGRVIGIWQQFFLGLRLVVYST